MADRTLTINHADGGSETYTINRDKFAGVREMSRGYVYPATQFHAEQLSTYWSATPTDVNDKTEWNLVSTLDNDGQNNFGSLKLAGIYTASKVRTGKHRVEFNLTLNSGVINNGASNLGDRPFVLVTRDHDDDPTTSASANIYEVVEGFNSIDVEVFDDGVEIAGLNFSPSIFLSARPSSIFDVTITNLKVTHEPDTVITDRTAPDMTQGHHFVDRAGESRPLLSKVAGGATAAYSLRDLNDRAGNNKVVRVRRDSDNAERDFKAKEVSNGTLTDWVNTNLTPYTQTGELTIPPSSGSGTYISIPSYSVNNTIGHTFKISFDLKRNTGGSGTSGFVGIRTTSTWDYTTLEKSSNLVEKNNRIEINTSTEDYQNYSVTCTTNSGSNENPIRFITYDSDDSYTVKNFSIEIISPNGFVETWYDQSGNGNDATQTSADAQPKIVDGGNLVTDNDGKTAINGKGTSLKLEGNVPMFSSDGTYSVFAVVDLDDQRNGNDTYNDFLRFQTKTNGGASSNRKPLFSLSQSSGLLTCSTPSFLGAGGGVFLNASQVPSAQLLTNIGNPALSTGNNLLYAQGSLISSSDTATEVNTETLTNFSSQIFDSQETTVDTLLSEVIYYPSDQSANRPAIEANIANQYGITLS